MRTEDEDFIVDHWSMWGLAGYPIAKRGSRWFVDGMRGIGAVPKAFRTKREAIAQWDAYIGVLIERGKSRD